MLHTAIVTHNIVTGNGQGRVNYELTRYLLDQGIEVTLIADKVAPELEEEGARWLLVHPSSPERIAALTKVWGFKQRADRLLQRIGDRFDVVIGCGVTLSVPHSINVVHFAHGGWRRSPYHVVKTNPSLNSAYQWVFSVFNDYWERQTLAQAKRIVAVSEMVKDELTASGIPAEKIEVIVNGVDLDEFHPGPADRTSLGLPADVPLGLFVGDICSPIKNPDSVLRALTDVPESHLAVAGSLEGSSLPDLARRLGISDRIHFLGFRRDIPDLMRAADFFTLPSRRDSCPLVLLEAMASGLPAIVSNNVGTAYLVEPDAGFVIDTPDDHRALQEAIHTLATSEDLRQQMGRAARAVAEHHSWKKMAEQYLHLLTRRGITERGGNHLAKSASR